MRDALLIVAGIAVLAVVLGVPIVRSRRAAASAEVPPLTTAILRVLPGANCGACGNASCFDAAREVSQGRAPSTLCVAGGSATSWAVAEVLRLHTIGQLR